MNTKIKLGALGSAVVGRVPVIIESIPAGSRLSGLMFSSNCCTLQWYKESDKRHYRSSFGSNGEYQLWNEGAPPFPGWWNAHFNPSYKGALDVWRWWDGTRWSATYTPVARIEGATYPHATKWEQERIRWNDRWPDGARVPRMIPEGYEQFGVLRGICGGLDLPSTQLALPLDEPKTLQQQLEESDW